MSRDLAEGCPSMAEIGEPISRTVVPARHGKAVLVREGEYLKVVDVQGQQVCDFFAFSPGDSTEFLSVCETRGALGRLSPEVGKPLYNNLGQPILLVVEDPVGIHDMRAAACDAFRYWFYAAPQHRACKMNVMEALQEFGMSPPVFPRSSQHLPKLALRRARQVQRARARDQAGRLRPAPSVARRARRGLRLPHGDQPLQRPQPH